MSRASGTEWAGDMLEALHAEWTKLRTLRGTLRLLLGVVAVSVALSAAAAAAVKCPELGCGQDPARVSLTGIQAGQAVAAVLGVLAIGGEYSSGMARLTFTAMPRRGTVLAAKAAVVGGCVLAAGAVAVPLSLFIGTSLLPGNGFSAAHGYTSLALTQAPMLRAAFGSVLYLVLIALLGLGVATVLRDPALAIGAVLGLLYLFPILSAVVSDPDWYRHLQQVAPMSAGLAVQATTTVGDAPLGPWSGLGVLAAWAAAALLIGTFALKRRDA